jgi:hypothetical protein
MIPTTSSPKERCDEAEKKKKQCKDHQIKMKLKSSEKDKKW